MIDGSEIKRARDRLGESQAAFAKRFGVNQSTIHRWETGDLAIDGIVLMGVESVLAKLSGQHPTEQTEAAE
jgi:DNA-binding transcriptional regulator YiaG